MDKTALRARLRTLRRRLAAEAPDAAGRAAAMLPVERLPPFESFSGYVALGSELDPRPVMRRLAGVSALPVAVSRDAPLEFRAWRDGEPLEPDAFGISAPKPDAAMVLPDLVICPLLAFDRRGGRLGQGAGHYDRTLQRLRAIKPVFALGLAYAGQEVGDLPQESHDQPLDAILTEIGYIALR